MADRIDIPTEDEAFISVKDHKDSFPSRVECRLINPAKNNIGVISKSILDKINTAVREATNSNQWLNTSSAIDWFNSITTKSNYTFFKFDIVSFYPSIKRKLLTDAIQWARSFTNISVQEVNVIMHCRKMFLFFEDECWVKKNDPCFDVSMGSLDSAEVCELVGLFLLSHLENLIPQNQLGLYRDDGLAVVNLPGPEVERLSKDVKKLFSKHNLKITTTVNTQTTDFLDVLFDLQTGLHRPFKKATSNPIYVHQNSNHPRNVKAELPQMIGRRISELSANRNVFTAEAPAYQHALKEAGYNHQLQYIEKPTTKKRVRKRNVTWFNPPWNDEVSTNIAKKFLAMLDRHFPKGSELHRYFNRNTVKVSYSSMPNMGSLISGHNKKILGATTGLEVKGCNCRPKDKANCPLEGKCQTNSLVYKSTVEAAGTTKEYIGLTANTFKERFTGHKQSFNHQKFAHRTTLSSYLWELKNKDIPFTQRWSIVSQAPAYSRKVRACHLCLMEKLQISLADPMTTLNKRNEIVAKCRHRDKMLLDKW